MSFYVVGGRNAAITQCDTLADARLLAEKKARARRDIIIGDMSGIKITGCDVPIEIFTENEWKNASRC